ncbi:hypothetical protein [Borrelia sp. RT5S]|uniref:hypothetical protein n=1 Tax=Borrelia sp. RT5S TaxID=2898581 RepID=UPI001E3C03C3|nr:hypothetical protein [Borrelia sp. RT5S]UGQ16768.1 hypothetical protein LSO06_05455 [Borrelia sp. RT5S]
MPINRNFIFVILLSFLSCDFSSLEKAKEVAGEVRSILESGEDVEVSGYADLAVTREEIDGVEVAVLSGNAGIGVSSASGSVGVNVEGSGYVDAAGKLSGHTVVSSKVETETGATGTTVYSSNTHGTVAGVSGFSDAVEITEATSPSPLGVVSGSYTGEMEEVEENDLEESDTLDSSIYYGTHYSGGTSSAVGYYGSTGFPVSGTHTGTVVKKTHGAHLREAKTSVKESLRLVKKIAKDYNSFSFYRAVSQGTRNLGYPKKREKAAEKAAEYTNERLNEDLNALLNAIKQCLNAATAATGGEGNFKSELKAKEQLEEVKGEIEKFVGEVKSEQKTEEYAYGAKYGARQVKLSKMEESLKNIKRLLYSFNKDSNLDD